MLGEFRDAVRSGMIPRGSYLLVESLDRLSRSKPRKALRLLEELCESGILVVTLADERVYTVESLDEDPMGLMYALMVAVRANEESATKSKRGRAAWEAKRSRAGVRPLTAVAPAWLQLRESRDGFDVIPERAEVVRRVYRQYLDGHGPHHIAELFNRERVPTFGRAKFWHRSYIIKMLDSESVVGIYTPHCIDHESGRKRRVPMARVSHYFPAIVGEQDFATVREMRRARRSPHGRTNRPISHLLAGLARCPACGAATIRVTKGATSKAGRPYLVCSRAKAGAGCNYRSVPVCDAEESVRESIDTLISSMPKGSPTLLDLEERLVRERNGLEAEMVRWLEELEQNGPSRVVGQMLRNAEAAHERTLDELSKVRARLNTHSATARPIRLRELKELLAEGEDRVAEANARLRSIFSEVTVDLERRRLIFLWSHGGETPVPLIAANVRG